MERENESALNVALKPYCDDCRKLLNIPEEAYKQYDIKRGLRNADGTGVLACAPRPSSVTSTCASPSTARWPPTATWAARTSASSGKPPTAPKPSRPRRCKTDKSRQKYASGGPHPHPGARAAVLQREKKMVSAFWLAGMAGGTGRFPVGCAPGPVCRGRS